MKAKFLTVLAILALIGAAPALAQNVLAPGLQPFSCFMESVAVTTQCQPATTAPFRMYVTGVVFTNDVATAQTIDLVYGTGTNCATGTTTVTNKTQFAAAVGNASYSFVPSAVIIPVGQAVCVRPSAATAFGATLTGYIAP